MEIKKFKSKIVFCFTISILLLLLFPASSPAAEELQSGVHHGNIIISVGVAILAATVVAYIGNLLKQPLLLSYIVAGIIIGPGIGFGLIRDINEIETISRFGLILLLFLIGFEINIKKLKGARKSLLVGGFTQFPITFIIGVGFFFLLGHTFDGGKYGIFYLAACCGLSSTAIVVKLLYGKFELDTLAGKISMGILVFQDIWAIVLLGIQPNLSSPDILQILFSFGKGVFLVVFTMLISKYILPRIFRSIAKLPELVLVSSLGWCFLVCGMASILNFSLEMGALIAGVAISTFPYNFDVMTKIVNIRVFFVTLFFVSLGMQVPNPFGNPSVLLIAITASVFLVVSRFLSIFPVLYLLRNGLRVSLLTSVNLSQMSEFSLVIASLGVAVGHINRNAMAVVIFIFVITSSLSTYMINYNDSIQKFLASLLRKAGIKDILPDEKQNTGTSDMEIALLGFHQNASSLLYELLSAGRDNTHSMLFKDKIVVVDFNPEIYEALRSMGVKVVYGDISHFDTLHRAGIHDVKAVICSIPDTMLVGTDNLKIIKHIKSICPRAKIIVTADNIDKALKMYAEGADYVFIPRILAAKNLAAIVEMILENKQEQMAAVVGKEVEMLKTRTEII
ncbi:MAG: cation:proton antiporter [bacterium]|nr:cation:proton antiporter [bacterium]